MGVTRYEPSAQVEHAHSIPHLSTQLKQLDATFNLNNTEYLISLLPLPILIGGVGLIAIFSFIIGILLRLLLLSTKACVRKCSCIPGAGKCHIFRCCICCRKGCTHPDSRCNQYCCCCYKGATRAWRAQTTLSAKKERHNSKRGCIMYHYTTILFFVLITDGFVFYGQQEMSKAIDSLARAISIVIKIFGGVVNAASQILLQLQHISEALVTPPCSPFVPQSDQQTALSHISMLGVASNNLLAFARPIVTRLSDLQSYLKDSVEPSITAVILIFFLVLLLVVFVYAVGELYQSRLLMRTSLFFSGLICIALTSVCSIAMALVMLMGDFCMDPGSNILSLIDDKESVLYNELNYYITCDGVNPYKPDLDLSVIQNGRLNVSIESIAQNSSVSASCTRDLFASSLSIKTQVASIQDLIDCSSVHAFYHEAINMSLCTWGFLGLYDIWITFFVASALLFFAMILSYAFYTWFLEVDVIGTGWFSDEEIKDTEEYKLLEFQMRDAQLASLGFGKFAMSEEQSNISSQPTPQKHDHGSAGTRCCIEDQMEHEHSPDDLLYGDLVELEFTHGGEVYKVCAIKH